MDETFFGIESISCNVWRWRSFCEEEEEEARPHSRRIEAPFRLSPRGTFCTQQRGREDLYVELVLPSCERTPSSKIKRSMQNTQCSKMTKLNELKSLNNSEQHMIWSCFRHGRSPDRVDWEEEGRSRNGTAETKRKRLAKKRPQDSLHYKRKERPPKHS